MEKDSDGFLAAETTSDQIILEALANMAFLPLKIKKPKESAWVQCDPCVTMSNNQLIVRYELPYKDTLFGMPCDTHIFFPVRVQEYDDGVFLVHLDISGNRPELVVIHDGEYATIPWNTANSTFWAFEWDKSKKKLDPLD